MLDNLIGAPPGFRYGSAIAIPPFISGQPIPDYFLRFSPVVMPVKVARFFMTTPAGLTTSGGTFSWLPSFADG